MPFWQKIKRCENCQFFNRKDASDEHGECKWRPERPPMWYATPVPAPVVRYDDGVYCEAYRHLKAIDQVHPLDNARSFLATCNVGDTIQMRTYEIGEVSRMPAVIEKHTRSFVQVAFLNGHYRIRLDPTDRERGGTVIGMERWGVDTHWPVQRGDTFTAHPEVAEPYLTRLQVNDWITLIGYPPFDGQRKKARVMRVQPNWLILQVGRKRQRMIRRGPLAGVIEGDVFVLDTTEDSDACKAQAPAQREAVAEGHDSV